MTSQSRGQQILRVRIDASRCDGQGVCKTVDPELFELDRYGDAYVVRDRRDIDPADHDALESAREAESMCPRAAIFIETIAIAPAPASPPPAAELSASPMEPMEWSPSSDAYAMLHEEDEAEDLDRWQSAGGFVRREPGTLRAQVELAGLHGQGGAGFPVARKWSALEGADPVIVANGAEREPGTVKDAHLLTRRPYLVIDGALAVAHDVGSRRVILAVPEGETEVVRTLRESCGRVADRGLTDGVDLEVTEVSAAYVAGEETALIACLQGEKPKPRLRPPYPARRGLYGRPTLVQNVETLALVGLVNAFDASTFLGRGRRYGAGVGLFSVGVYGDSFRLVERPMGYRLDHLLAEAGFGNEIAAVLVGGFSGGLLRSDQLAVPLTRPALAASGARLGTKSVQVLVEGMCPLQVVVDVLGFFGQETAEQCPPCYRGLPDMRDIAADIEQGRGTQESLADFREFMETLPGRGICALPDGAAAIAMSYLRNFPEDLQRHLEAGCPGSSKSPLEFGRARA